MTPTEGSSQVRQTPSSGQDVGIIHDYLTQRGGAERVVLALATEAFAGAPIHTSMYDPAGTFAEFAELAVNTLWLDRIGWLRRHHRLSLPLLGRSFSALEVPAAVAVCSSSGWAHRARVTGRKIVYCHSPARWLYQPERYLGSAYRFVGKSWELYARRARLMDRRAALSAHRYVVNSKAVRDRVWDLYQIDAEVVAPPAFFTAGGPEEPVPGVEPGFVLCVTRLLPYKNAEAVVEAFASSPERRLVVAGTGPLEAALRAKAPPNVTFLGEVADPPLRWLYRSCWALVAASYEDFGLTPVEAASFGRPSAVLRWGGFLDTMVEGETGVFFDQPDPGQISSALDRLAAHSWDPQVLRRHAEQFSVGRFAERMRQIVAEEVALA